MAMIFISCLTGCAPPPVPPQKVETFVNDLTRGRFAAAEKCFDAKMREVLPREKLKVAWSSAATGRGRYRGMGRVETERDSGYIVKTVTIRFSCGTLNLRIVYNAAHQVTGLFFLNPVRSAVPWLPPKYVDKTGIIEDTVFLGREPWRLSGTLTRPASGDPHAGVVLVHGSGPNDRDETIGASRPFKDLAWGLASRGIAVLRYEKRTYAYQGDPAFQSGVFTADDEVVADAVAAVKALSQEANIDSGSLFLLGHSLGGMLAPKIVSQAPSLKGAIIMAGNVRPLDELFIDQLNYLAMQDGYVDNVERKQIVGAKALFDSISELNRSPERIFDFFGNKTSAGYWMYLNRYNPAVAAKKLHHPLLILQGERDYQVTMTDFNLWQKALGGKTNVTLRSYPNLNHLFISGNGPSIPDEYRIPGHVASRVVVDIAEWIAELN